MNFAQIRHLYEFPCEIRTNVGYNRDMETKPMVNIERLEQLMENRGLDMGKLAAYSGVSYDTIFSIRKGRRKNTSTKIIKKLAAGLGVTVDQLLMEENEKKPTLPDAIQRLILVAQRLPEARQDELLHIAATLERLEAKQPTGDDMRQILEVIELMREQGASGDLLALLEELVRRMLGR